MLLQLGTQYRKSNPNLMRYISPITGYYVIIVCYGALMKLIYEDINIYIYIDLFNASYLFNANKTYCISFHFKEYIISLFYLQYS